jgi:hypothetical protein
MIVYHALHGLTYITSEADGPVTSCGAAVLTGLQNWDNHCSLQAAGAKFSVHTQLYMDSRNSLPVGGR